MGACSAALVAGCVRDAAPQPERPPREVATWDFPASAAPVTLRLWPALGSTPQRFRRHLQTDITKDRLTATVEGKDPFFSWTLQTPLSATFARIELESDAPGRLQLFWTNAACPVFTEQCSATDDLRGGREIVSFFLDPREPIRDLRLDLPERRDRRLSFDSITIQSSAALDTSWTGREDTVALEGANDELRITAFEDDPWLTITTPGLLAERVGAVELVLHGPSTPPVLYWAGPCPQFSEDCSARFESADAGSLTHRIDLRRSPRWKGPIRALRLDPGPGAGEYSLEHLALVTE